MPETVPVSRRIASPLHEVHRGVVPRDVTTTARRRLLLELRRCGVTAQHVLEWGTSTWWPSLREEPAFLAVRDHLEPVVAPGDVWAETQILVRLPDEDDVGMGPPHVDALPPWAPGRGLRYKRILGVELTDTPERGGGTVMHTPEGLVPVRQREGDVLSFHPDALHSGSPNHSGDMRLALFFRLLEPA